MIARKVATVLQRRLQTVYGLEEAPCVSDYVTLAPPGQREQVLLRQLEEEEYIELRLVVPECPLSDALVPSRLSDRYLQVVEGVSHFVLLAECIRMGRSTTQLELELQAEVDKLVLIQQCLRNQPPHESAALHGKLYGSVSFLHAPDTEQGERYRLANRVAAKFTKHLFQRSPGRRRELLRRFYRAALSDKLHMSQAA